MRNDPAILGVVEEADDLPPGVVSMPHNWGALPARIGTSVRSAARPGRLISDDGLTDRWVGMPRMSAIPVFLGRAEGS